MTIVKRQETIPTVFFRVERPFYFFHAYTCILIFFWWGEDDEEKHQRMIIRNKNQI